MRQFINIITGFLFALAPLAGAGIIGLAFYASMPNSTGIIIICLLLIIAIWIGVQIFKKIQIIGPLEFMSAVNASPDLDNLEPVPGSQTKRRQPEELVSFIKKKGNLCKGGAIRVYGDWFGTPYDNHHEIDQAHYDNKEQILIIIFADKTKLEIFNPTHIFEASTFLKIIHADQIRLSGYYHGKPEGIGNTYYINYQKGHKEIKVSTNVDRGSQKHYVSLGASALMIYR